MVNDICSERCVMATSSVILVTGATGNQGGAVARSLLQQGQKVRALTRNPANAEALRNLGAEVVIGDLTDRASLDRALQGEKRAFLVVTFFEAGLEAELTQGIVMADAAKAAGVEQLVFSSVGSAHRRTGIPHFETKRKVEQHIEKLGIPTTILRPTAFMENFRLYWAPSPQGILMLPFHPDTKLQLVAVQDIGTFAAAAFLRPDEFIDQAIDLAGDELTMPEVAGHLSRAMGRTVKFQPIPDDQAEAAVGQDFAFMFRWFNEVGYNADIPDLPERWGIPLTTFEDLVAGPSWPNGS